MSTATEPDYEARLLTGIRAALRKARQLGYDVERMDVTASVSQGVGSVHLAPLPAPGTLRTGGDLSLTVDPRTEDVIEYKRGQ